MFEDRSHAGELLGVKIAIELKKRKCDLVQGITRGGVVVAAEAAKTLRLALDIIVVKKLGAPQNPELALGAIGPENSVFLDKKLLEALHVAKKELMAIVIAKEHERFEQEMLYRGDTKPLSVKGKAVILIDDGIATGATAFCALKYLRQQQARVVILAVPVIAHDAYRELAKEFDSVVALRVESRFRSVGQFYRDFRQVGDEDVRKILDDRR